jgi:acetyltransferase
MTDRVGSEDEHSSSELHETIRGGEHVLIRPVQPEDMALYPDFLRDVSPDDLRLRFFAIARVAELSAAEIKKLGHLDYSQEMAFVALDEDTSQMLGLVRRGTISMNKPPNSRFSCARESKLTGSAGS